jgi:hypothetical protein
MSLIEEALRRLNDPLLKETAPPTPAGAPAPAHPWQVSPQTPSGSRPRALTANPLQLVALSIGVLTTTLLIGGAFWLGRILSGASTQAAAVSAAATAQETVPPPQEPEPKLTGIVVGGGAPYAVINGTIAGLGDQVGAFRLQEIVEGAVTLRRDDGTELVLRAKR